MKPERVQSPSILAPGEGSVTWKINTGSFEISGMVSRVISSVLQKSTLQKTINMSDDWVELWVSNTTAKSEAEVRELMPQVKQAAEECLQDNGMKEEQAAIRGV